MQTAPSSTRDMDSIPVIDISPEIVVKSILVVVVPSNEAG